MNSDKKKGGGESASEETRDEENHIEKDNDDQGGVLDREKGKRNRWKREKKWKTNQLQGFIHTP